MEQKTLTIQVPLVQLQACLHPAQLISRPDAEHSNQQQHLQKAKAKDQSFVAKKGK